MKRNGSEWKFQKSVALPQRLDGQEVKRITYGRKPGERIEVTAFTSTNDWLFAESAGKRVFDDGSWNCIEHVAKVLGY